MQRQIIRAFDVDGTLSNSLNHNYRTTIRSHCHFSLICPTLEEYRDKYDQSDGFRKLQLGIGVPEKKLQVYNAYWWKTYCDMVAGDPPMMIPGAKENVNSLASKGNYLILLTKATEQNTDHKLGMVWVRKVFKETVFIDDRFDKEIEMAKLRARMNGNGLIYFGDTISDGQACLRSGIKFGAMIHEYSYNSENMLMAFVKAHPEMAVAVRGVTDFDRAAEEAFR